MGSYASPSVCAKILEKKSLEKNSRSKGRVKGHGQLKVNCLIPFVTVLQKASGLTPTSSCFIFTLVLPYLRKRCYNWPFTDDCQGICAVAVATFTTRGLLAFYQICRHSRDSMSAVEILQLLRQGCRHLYLFMSKVIPHRMVCFWYKRKTNAALIIVLSRINWWL